MAHPLLQSSLRPRLLCSKELISLFTARAWSCKSGSSVGLMMRALVALGLTEGARTAGLVVGLSVYDVQKALPVVISHILS